VSAESNMSYKFIILIKFYTLSYSYVLNRQMLQINLQLKDSNDQYLLAEFGLADIFSGLLLKFMTKLRLQ